MIISPSFFDIVLQKKVRQVGLSETGSYWGKIPLIGKMTIVGVYNVSIQKIPRKAV